MTLSPRAAGLGAALLLACLAFQVGAFIVSHSNTFDEAAVISAGYSYVKTGRLELETGVHPPLLKYLFGLAVAVARPELRLHSRDFIAGRSYEFGHDFLFHNTAPAETLLSLARLPSLLLSLGMAAALFAWARRWYGPAGALLALAACVFEPDLLAHSGLANMDLALAAFLFAAYYSLFLFLDETSGRGLAAAGVLAGCAMATKLPGVYFLAWTAVLPFLLVTQHPWRWTAKLALKLTAWVAVLAFAVVALCYQVRYLPKGLELLATMFQVIFGDHPTEQHFNFLHGDWRKGGWWHYYLVALWAKLPLPFLGLAALGLSRLDARERRVVLLPVLSWLAVCTVASKQEGLRYVLPILPFLCLAAGAAARLKGARWSAVLGLLVAWQAFEAARIFPNYLAYFSQAVGGPRNGHRWLVASNLDWGQDFPRLRSFLKDQGDPELILACLGTGDHGHYFGRHQDLIARFEHPYEHANSSAPAREVLVVSASFLQGFGLSDPHAFAWLRGREPLAQPGHGSFVYDVTGDALSQFNIGKLYMAQGKFRLARRQFERAAALAPDNAYAWLGLGDAARALGSEREATVAFRRAAASAKDDQTRELARQKLAHRPPDPAPGSYADHPPSGLEKPREFP